MKNTSAKILFLAAFFLSLPIYAKGGVVEPSAVPSSLPRLQDIAPALRVDQPALRKIYVNALKNLDTQFVASADGTVYVSTGDIKAEWLRDSSVQVRPFLFFAKTNPEVAQLVKGVIVRQARYMALDPYANAFYENYTIHERKYELDSLANPILLAWTYWKVTGDSSVFNAEVWKGFKAALATMQIEQDHGKNSKYTHPHLSKNLSAPTGMIWSGFRPSDDACTYHFLIPSQAMAAQALHALAEIARDVVKDSETELAAKKMENEVLAGIEKYGKVKTYDGKTVYAYEVDGLGNYVLMDDANLPSLMSLPIYGFVDVHDPIYQATRARNLSPENPFYFVGKLISGIGSPHTPKNMVWPLSLLSQAITSTTEESFNFALDNLIKSDYGKTGLHESVHVDNASKFTRADFGWPNAMFVEMALNHWNGLPELPKVQRPSQR